MRDLTAMVVIGSIFWNINSEHLIEIISKWKVSIEIGKSICANIVAFEAHINLDNQICKRNQ